MEFQWKKSRKGIIFDTIMGYYEIYPNPQNSEKFVAELRNDYGDFETFNDKQFDSQQEAIDFCKKHHEKYSPIMLNVVIDEFRNMRKSRSVSFEKEGA